MPGLPAQALRARVYGKYLKRGSAEETSLNAQIGELNIKADLLFEILWTVLRAQLKVEGAKRIGLRKDWKVVTGESIEDTFQGFVRNMMGRGR